MQREQQTRDRSLRFFLIFFDVYFYAEVFLNPFIKRRGVSFIQNKEERERSAMFVQTIIKSQKLDVSTTSRARDNEEEGTLKGQSQHSTRGIHSRLVITNS